MLRLVTLNGPIGSGKSPVREEIIKKNPDTPIYRISFQDVLITGTMAMLGVTHDMPYAAFKTSKLYGLTGREWMIRFAASAREHDVQFFSKVMHDRMLATGAKMHGRNPIFISDSNGFEDELFYFRGHPEVQLLACSIEPEGCVARGEQYPGDSRYNLAHYCAVVTGDSYRMVDELQAAMRRRDWV